MDNSTIIYKYRTWRDDFHKDVLKKNELFFSSPADMNDPFDCKIPINLTQLDTDQKRKEYADHFINISMKNLLNKGLDVELYRKQLLYNLENQIQETEDEYDNVSFKFTDLRFGVLSFSYRWDSILMWSHYSANHKGFCIGFDKSKLLESDIYGIAGEVKYENTYPSIIVNEDIFQQVRKITHSKANDWSYEKEYRLAKIWSENNPTIKDRIINFPDDYITEIILGLFITQEDKTAILRIAEEKQKPVYEIRKKRKAILLERVKIN